MNTQLTLSMVKVNDGLVQKSERPLFVGVTKVADSTNGRLVNASVTVDRDWLWVRFSSIPSESWRGKLTSNGFTYSRKRSGWHAPLEEHKTKFIQELGALPVTIEAAIKAASAPMPEEKPITLTKQEEIEVDMSDERRARHTKVESRVKEARKQESKPKSKVATAPQPKQEAATSPQYDELMATIARQQATIEKLTAQVSTLIEKLTA